MSKGVVTNSQSERANCAEHRFAANSTLGRLNVRLLVLSAIFVLAAVASSCSDQNEPTSTLFPLLDPSTATLEEILSRTRTAMDEITSYKTRGTVRVEGMNEDDGGSGEYFTAWQAPDRFMFRTEGRDRDSVELQVMEFRTIGTRSFVGNPGEEWQEMQPRPEGDEQPARSSQDPRSRLYRVNFK